MNSIANLKTFTKEELLFVLTNCATHLAFAYQETMIDALREASFEASMACESLQCEIAVQNNYQFH